MIIVFTGFPLGFKFIITTQYNLTWGEVLRISEHKLKFEAFKAFNGSLDILNSLIKYFNSITSKK